MSDLHPPFQSGGDGFGAGKAVPGASCPEGVGVAAGDLSLRGLRERFGLVEGMVVGEGNGGSFRIQGCFCTSAGTGATG
jgi:hypothetical protein